MLRKTKNITREHEELIREKHREKAVTNKSVYNFSHGINGQSLDTSTFLKATYYFHHPGIYFSTNIQVFNYCLI